MYLSLVGCMYRIISKVTVNEIKWILPLVICKRKSSFLGDLKHVA